MLSGKFWSSGKFWHDNIMFEDIMRTDSKYSQRIWKCWDHNLENFWSPLTWRFLCFVFRINIFSPEISKFLSRLRKWWSHYLDSFMMSIYFKIHFYFYIRIDYFWSGNISKSFIRIRKYCHSLVLTLILISIKTRIDNIFAPNFYPPRKYFWETPIIVL